MIVAPNACERGSIAWYGARRAAESFTAAAAA
jgi:hypothetical protein